MQRNCNQKKLYKGPEPAPQRKIELPTVLLSTLSLITEYTVHFLLSQIYPPHYRLLFLLTQLNIIFWNMDPNTLVLYTVAWGVVLKTKLS